MRMVPRGKSYITPHGASEFGSLSFPDDGKEGIYTISHSSTPLSLVPVSLSNATPATFDQSATIPLTGLQEQPRKEF
jgi:hypothetical protein